VQPTLFVRALIVFGMALGVVGVGSLFAVGGAAIGAAVSILSGPVKKPAIEGSKA